jgi:hypothetical protein
MEIVNEFFDKMCLHTEYKHHLPANYDHKLRVMQAITQALHDDPATLDVQNRYHCNNCGNDFETFSSVDTFDGYVDACPECRSLYSAVTDNLALTDSQQR